MMVCDVIELSTSRLSDPVLAEIAGILGLEPSHARTAVEQAAAAILGGMLKMCAAPDGVDSLLAILDRWREDLSQRCDLESLLASRKSTLQLQQPLRKLISSVFGDRLGSVLSLIGGLLGLSRERAETLLGLVAPLVLAQLDEHWAACGGEPERLVALIQNQLAAVRRLEPAGLATALGLGSLARLSDHSPQASNQLQRGPSPSTLPGGECHFEPDPAIELGTRLANWMVPVILASLGLGAIYGLRANPETRFDDMAPAVPIAGQQTLTRSEIGLGPGALLTNLVPSRPLTRLRSPTGAMPAEITVPPPGNPNRVGVCLPNGSRIEVIKESAYHRLIQTLESPGVATRGGFVLEEITLDRATSELTKASEPAIDVLARILEAYPAASAILIEREASEIKAAQAVHRRLIDLGLDPTRIGIRRVENSPSGDTKAEGHAPGTAGVELVVSPHS